MQQIVINQCRRGTLLSDAGKAEYLKRSGTLTADWTALDRSDPILVALMKENPGAFGGRCAHISIVALPDGFKWKLMSKGNFEWIAADVGG